MLLEEVVGSVKAQLDDQASLGVRIDQQGQVPEAGPAGRGLWWRIPNVTCVFADLKRSTSLSANGSGKNAALAYTYFIRAMTVVLDGFSAGYIDIQGDGIFGLFSGSGSEFMAAASAITMRTEVEGDVYPRFKRDSSSNWKLSVGIGIDRGTLLVRRLGLRGARQNEVWAGKPVNMAAKLSSCAGDNQLVVSERVFASYGRSSKLRQRALLWSCGCSGKTRGAGLNVASGTPSSVWIKESAPRNLGLDFGSVYKRSLGWCAHHGSGFCEAIVSNKLP